MKKWLLIGFGLVVIAVAVVVVVVVANLGNLREMQPEIRGVSLRWGEITPSTTEVLGTVLIYNPNSFSVPIKDISCEIRLDNILVGNARTNNLLVKEQAEFPIDVIGNIENASIPTFWAEHIKRDEKSEIAIGIHATLELGGVDITIPYTFRRPIETDILSYLGEIEPLQIEKKSDIPLLGERTIFKISLESLSAQWGEVTEQNTRINMVALIHNDNLYPLLVPRLKCVVESNGLILGTGETTLLEAFLPKHDHKLEVEAILNSDLMDEWFVEHIRRGENSSFDIRLFMDFGVPQEALKLIGQDDLSITLWEGSLPIETDVLGMASKM